MKKDVKILSLEDAVCKYINIQNIVLVVIFNE